MSPVSRRRDGTREDREDSFGSPDTRLKLPGRSALRNRGRRRIIFRRAQVLLRDKRYRERTDAWTRTAETIVAPASNKSNRDRLCIQATLLFDHDATEATRQSPERRSTGRDCDGNSRAIALQSSSRHDVRTPDTDNLRDSSLKSSITMGKIMKSVSFCSQHLDK